MKIKLFFIVFLPLFVNCSRSELQDDVYKNIPLEFIAPSNFPSIAYNIVANSPTQKGFELGKKLFYDGRLSADGTISCGFCHIQQDAFTHHGHTISHGINNAMGTRNAPALQNLAYQTQFMWDGAADNLDFQIMIPLQSPIEMDGNLTTILQLLKSDLVYKKLFTEAFVDGAVNAENMQKALSQFMIMLVSSNSKFDKYRRNQNNIQLTDNEHEGYTIFKSKCASCHATDLFTDNSFRNNGLPVNSYVNDLGRYILSHLPEDKYKFKVPSLRNVAVTAPYMHDGRFGTLDAVLNHYSNGIVSGATLDPILNQFGVIGISLTSSEKSKLIAFLKTLTDDQFLNDVRFSDN